VLRRIFGPEREEVEGSWRKQPHIQWVPGGGGLASRVKWPGRKTHHSPPSSAEVKKEWSHTSIPTSLHNVMLN
jgi:hypothetical protein